MYALDQLLLIIRTVGKHLQVSSVLANYLITIRQVFKICNLIDKSRSLLFDLEHEMLLYVSRKRLIG